jgi:hypothetical protein
MQRRQLAFHDLAEVKADLDRLQRAGYERVGNWDLAQTCDHLAYFIEGSLDGHKFRVPWLLKALFGRLVLRRILSRRQMKAGVPTPQKPLPAPGGDPDAAADRLRRALDRLASHPGELHASPFFGYLTPQQWRDLHLIHCGHHLSFLVPRAAQT